MAYFNKAQIEEIKAYSIVDFLTKKGFKLDSETTSEYIFKSYDKQYTGALFVNKQKNLFYDFAGSENNNAGSIIDLVMYLYQVNFLKACEMLYYDEHIESFFTPEKINTEQKPKLELFYVGELNDSALLNYCHNRAISTATAKKYLKEIRYNVTSKDGKKGSYKAVGFKNDLGGFALRSEKFKGQTKPNAITTIEGLKNDKINVFEGFFSFLSFVEYYGGHKNTCVILNSINNLSKLTEHLSHDIIVNSFLDNDPKGNEAHEKIKQRGFMVDNQRYIFKPFCDFNEFLLTNSFR